jgi:hypothetical protein
MQLGASEWPSYVRSWLRIQPVDPTRPFEKMPLSLQTEHRINDFPHGSLSDKAHMPWIEL